MNESWKVIKGFPAYEVSDLGRVRSNKGKKGRPPKILRPFSSGKYLKVSLTKNQAIFQRYIHHLVIEAFVGPRPLDHEACHLDGKRHNNEATNLAYLTHKQNLAMMSEHGTSTKGSSLQRNKNQYG